MTHKFQNNRAGRPYPATFLYCSILLYRCYFYAFSHCTRNMRHRTRASTRPTTRKRIEQTEVSCSSSRASSGFWLLKRSSTKTTMTSSSPGTVVSRTQRQALLLSILYSLFFFFLFFFLFLLCALFRSEGPARWRKESNGVSDDRLFDRLRRDERLETRDERREGQRDKRAFLLLDHSSLESSHSSSSSSPPCSSSPSRFPPATRA